ncbi:MAG: glycosyltransferase family 2 protein [Anaerolineae bacterium]|nr:glycosyltransferase family 2 protein [Anaerolineae bacterium]
MQETVDIGIVIVNWNTRNYLRDCLASVFASEGVSYRVVAVDNASSDDSAAMVRAEFPQAELIASPVNGGYPYGNNIGLRRLGFDGGDETTQPGAPLPRYALLLNPDTELPPAALRDMARFMDEHPEYGAAGPKLVLADGSLDRACRRGFPAPMVSVYHMSGLAKVFPKSRRFARYNMTYLDPDQGAEVDSVTGAFMMVRREAVEKVGLLDEAFFMYGEDLDWAYRIKAAGWKIYYHPAVVVRHYKRAASKQSRRAPIEFYRAMLIFYRKHYQARTSWLLHNLILLGLILKGGRPIIEMLREGGRAG